MAAAPVAGFNAATENLKPGTPRASVPTHWSATPKLEAYLGQHASTAGRRVITLYVNSSLHSIRILAYRLGDYGGAGQRLVWKSNPVKVSPQPRFTVQHGTRMVTCPWKVTTSIDTSEWPEGFYYLILTAGGGHDHLIPLVVESASMKGKSVLVFNDCTMQAYNKWGRYSLYTGPKNSRARRSYKVSFDRPYENHQEFEHSNAPLIRAAEAIADSRLNLAYTTEARITGHPALVSGATAVIFSGHSEYWSPALRRTIETARNRGTNVIFCGANNVYWRTRTEPSKMGPDRILVCYRKATLDPVRRAHPDAATTRWRDGPRASPESSFTGALYGDLRVKGTFTVSDPHFFAFEGIGAPLGATFPGLTGGETDRVYTRRKGQAFVYPPDLHVFAHSPAAGKHDAHGWADSTFYTTASGSGVLNMASVDWLKGMFDPKVPLNSRRFAMSVTQNIVIEASLGPLGRRFSSDGHRISSRQPTASAAGRQTARTF
ncbi:hypothetical protein ABIE00_003649 [Arthrobacter sp. OAP107]